MLAKAAASIFEVSAHIASRFAHAMSSALSFLDKPFLNQNIKLILTGKLFELIMLLISLSSDSGLILLLRHLSFMI